MNPLIELFPQRARVFIKALPTYLAAVTASLVILAGELIPLLPDNIGAQVAGWLAVVLAVIAAVVKVIRNVEPVEPERAGMLPVAEGRPEV